MKKRKKETEEEENELQLPNFMLHGFSDIKVGQVWFIGTSDLERSGFSDIKVGQVWLLWTSRLDRSGFSGHQSWTGLVS